MYVLIVARCLSLGLQADKEKVSTYLTVSKVKLPVCNSAAEPFGLAQMPAV